jgi:hypothetical protein
MIINYWSKKAAGDRSDQLRDRWYMKRDKFVKILLTTAMPLKKLYRYLVSSRFVTGQKWAIAAVVSNLARQKRYRANLHMQLSSKT